MQDPHELYQSYLDAKNISDIAVQKEKIKKEAFLSSITPSNINHQGPLSQTLLHRSILAHDFSTAILLIKNKANFHMLDEFGFSPAYYAFCIMHEELLSTMIDYGLDINNPKDGAGNSPLNQRAMEGNIDNVKILLKLGADIKTKNDLGEDILVGINNHITEPALKLQLIKCLFRHGLGFKFNFTDDDTLIEAADGAILFGATLNGMPINRSTSIPRFQYCIFTLEQFKQAIVDGKKYDYQSLLKAADNMLASLTQPDATIFEFKTYLESLVKLERDNQRKLSLQASSARKIAEHLSHYNIAKVESIDDLKNLPLPVELKQLIVEETKKINISMVSIFNSPKTAESLSVDLRTTALNSRSQEPSTPKK